MLLLDLPLTEQPKLRPKLGPITPYQMIYPHRNHFQLRNSPKPNKKQKRGGKTKEKEAPFLTAQYQPWLPPLQQAPSPPPPDTPASHSSSP